GAGERAPRPEPPRNGLLVARAGYTPRRWRRHSSTSAEWKSRRPTTRSKPNWMRFWRAYPIRLLAWPRWLVSFIKDSVIYGLDFIGSSRLRDCWWGRTRERWDASRSSWDAACAALPRPSEKPSSCPTFTRSRDISHAMR